MSLVTLRTAIRDTIDEEVEGLVNVDTHGGRFDLDEIKRWAKAAPCVVVGALGMPATEYEGGTTKATVEWGAFVVTRDTTEKKRDELALVLVEAVLGVVTYRQRWGDDYAHKPESIKATNLYGGRLDATGLALWAITWTQGYDINAFDISTLDDFLIYQSTTTPEHAALETTPAPSDTVTLEGEGS